MVTDRSEVEDIKKIFLNLKDEHKQILKNAYELISGATNYDIDDAFTALHELQETHRGCW